MSLFLEGCHRFSSPGKYRKPKCELVRNLHAHVSSCNLVEFFTGHSDEFLLVERNKQTVSSFSYCDQVNLRHDVVIWQWLESIQVAIILIQLCIRKSGTTRPSQDEV
jgi:hypothetical protein